MLDPKFGNFYNSFKDTVKVWLIQVAHEFLLNRKDEIALYISKSVED